MGAVQTLCECGVEHGIERDESLLGVDKTREHRSSSVVRAATKTLFGHASNTLSTRSNKICERGAIAMSVALV